MKKSAFLLHDVPTTKLSMPGGAYDPVLMMNMINVEGRRVPYVLVESAPTESKTFQYPADDDPDPDDERCY